MMSAVTIVGRLGADAEISRNTETPILRLRVAVTVRVNREKATNWYAVALFGRRAEALYGLGLTKGTTVAVSGSLVAREYDTRDGTRRTSLDIVASDIALLGGAKAQRSDDAGAGEVVDDVPF